jgi:hypothetical protein
MTSTNGSRWILFPKALATLIIFDLLLYWKDFKTLHRVVSSWKVKGERACGGCVDRVCAGVNLACSWYPKRALCLQRASVTTVLLRNAGISAQMVLGVQQLPFKAHAWVEVNGKVVNEITDVRAVYSELERC